MMLSKSFHRFLSMLLLVCMLKTLEAGGEIEGLNELNQIISVEKGFDAMTICRQDILTYGLG